MSKIEEFVNAVAGGLYVNAIKIYREDTGCSLEESKLAVDKIMTRYKGDPVILKLNDTERRLRETTKELESSRESNCNLSIAMSKNRDLLQSAYKEIESLRKRVAENDRRIHALETAVSFVV